MIAMAKSFMLLLQVTIAFLLLKRSTVFGKPRIRSQIRNITVDYCTVFKRDISSLYYDDEPGQNIELRLLAAGNYEVQPSWPYLNLDKTTKTLYSVPTSKSLTETAHTPGEWYYTIRVENPATKAFVDDSFWLIFKGAEHVNKRNYGYGLENKVLTTRSSDVMMLYNYVERIFNFFNIATTEKIIQVYDYEFLEDNRLNVYIQNCTMRETPCDDGNTERILRALKSTDFSEKLLPKFNKTKVTPNKLDPCNIENFGPGLTTENFMKIYVFKTIHEEIFIDPYPGMYRWELPRLFSKEETQETYFINQLLLHNPDPTVDQIIAPKSYWAFINNNVSIETNTLLITITDATYQSPTTPRNISGIVYQVASLVINAIDSRNKNAFFRPTFFMPYTEVRFAYYSVRFNFTGFQTGGSELFVMHTHIFLNSTIRSLGEYYRSFIFLNSFHLDGASNIGSALWSLKVYPGCNFTMIRLIQAILFKNPIDEKQINPILQQSLAGTFSLTSITEYFNGKCTIEPPTIRYEFPELSIPFCGVYTYQVPEDMFFDQQDGGTRNLSLILTELDNAPVSVSSWINVDPITQQIYAVIPASFAVSAAFHRSFTFKLKVIDNSGESIVTDVNIAITGMPKQVGFEISVKGIYTPSVTASNLTVSYFLATKVNSWLKNDGAMFQLQESVVTSQLKKFLTFSTCEWRYDPCDAIKIAEYKNKFFDDTGLANVGFSDSLSPEFTDVTVSFTTSGPCQNDRKPSVEKQWGPFTMNTCETFNEKVPVDAFRDLEQGDTRSLDLTLTGTAPSPLDLPDWIHFDTVTQTLTVVPYIELTVTDYTFTLSAFDINKRSAIQNIEAKINSGNAVQPSHIIRMTFKVANPRLSGFVTIYSKLRERLKTYLGEQSNVIQYITMTAGSEILTVKWTHCGMSKAACETEQISNLESKFIFNGNPSPSFVQSLRIDFAIETVTFSNSGICVTEKQPPVVSNIIPEQTIYYCSVFRYQVPANTFTDKIDGNTRNLKLSATYQGPDTLPGWIAFDIENQEFVVVLQSVLPVTDNVTEINVTATTTRGLSVSTVARFKLGNSPHKRGKYLRAFAKILTPAFTSASPVTYAVFLEKVSQAFKLTESNVHYYSVRTRISGSNEYIISELISCNFKNCSHEEIPRLEIPLSGKYDPSAFQPNFDLSNPTVLGETECGSNKKPPKVIQNIHAFTVSRCSAFKKAVTAEIIEYEDTFDDLRFIVKTINGVPINPQTSWIYMEKNVITGVVTHSVIGNNPSRIYNVTVSVSDPDGNEVVTWAAITVSGKLPQLYYQYEMQVADKIARSTSLSFGLSRQIDVTNLINNYFKYDIVDIVSYEDMINDKFNLIWSVCPLPDKCSDTGLTDSEDKMFNAGQPISEFTDIFKPDFELEVLRKKVSGFCSGPLNPPRASEDPFTIDLPYCGGFSYVIPENLFNDPEEGNTRNLKLYFETSKGSPASDTYPWLQFDQSKQEIKGMPLYINAKLITESKKVFYLRAKDKSGLEKSIVVYLRFPLTQDPKFFFAITISNKVDPSDVNKRFIFMDKIAQFRKDSNRNSIGFSTLRQTPTKLEIYYFNCTLKYSPCNLYELRKMKAEFSDENGFPTAEFRDIMKPEFTVDYVHSSMISPCGDPYPPTLLIVPPVLNILMCEVFHYIIPENTFYDTEQGFTRNLDLALAPKGGSTFQMTSFVQFVTSTQSLVVIPSAYVLSAQNSQKFSFTLTATDNSNLKAITELKMNIQGPYSLLEECQIQITLTQLSSSSHSSRSNIEVMQYIIKKLASFFSITEQEIGVVKFTQLSSTSIIFAWSYCSAIYQTEAYLTNNPNLAVDYYNLQTQILMRLFDNKKDRKLNPNFQSAFSNEYKVDKVETKFTGRCRDLPPIATPSHKTITILIQYGGYALHKYTDNYFYDFEDGGTFSLDLSFLTSTNKTVLIDHWINIDYTLHTIYTIVTDVVRSSTAASSIFKYNLIATDKAGQTAVIVVTVLKYTTILNFAPFNITYALQYNKVSSMIYVRQAVYLIDAINNYFSSVTSSFYVLVRWYTKTAGYSQYRIFTFSVANHDCSSQVLTTIKTAYTQGVLDESLISSVSQMFTLHRVYNETSCSTDPDPPSPVDPLPDFNVSFCRSWTYTLPRTVFHDTENGETIGLKLSLLDNNGNAVPSSSWFQLNTVTRQLYAVAIQSVAKTQSKFTYFIQATNSRNLHRKISLLASMEDKPYTVDCKMMMNFQYKYMTGNIVDLDIIRTFISMVAQYYGDSTENKVKILDFIKFPDSYNVTWSNCSFAFSTSAQARTGLVESDRQRITAIFSRVFSSSTNQIQTHFKTFMGSYFVIRGMSVSYDCIEEPPIPSTDGYRVFPKFCQLFNDSIPRTAFYDKRDGDTRNLKLTLLDKNQKRVTLESWVQLDNMQNVYGVVTEKVKEESPPSGYKYYIQATDSSGRSAKLEYIIKIASPKKLFNVYFRTGFRNNYSALTPSATILYTFVEKLSKYINAADSSGKIYVKEFQYPYVIIWSPCSLETSCKYQDVRFILQKLRTTSGDITTEFVFRMYPEFVPTQQQIEMKNPCGSSNITITVNPPSPNTTLPVCGFFRFQAPTYLFNDLIGRNTRYFYLNFLNQDSTPINIDSWIRFNGPGQFVYGLNILSKTPSISNYRLQAVMPDSGYTAYTPVIFRNDYRILHSLSQHLCWVEFHMTVNYNPLYDDVSIIEIFMKIISSYLKSTYNQIQVLNYTRTRDEYPFSMTVTWTNCSMTSMFQQEQFADAYYTSVRAILQQFLTVSSNGQYKSMNQQVRMFFQQNSLLQLTSITTNGKCKVPDQTPPKANKPVVIEIKCGIFKEQVPNDTFIDNEDGDTRQLTLKILLADASEMPSNSWVIIDQNQYIYGMIDNATILGSPTNREYQFLIKATDSNGQSSTTPLTIKLPLNPFPPSIMKLNLFVMSTSDISEDIVPKLIITKAIQDTLASDLNADVDTLNLYINVFLKIKKSMQIQLENCDSCDALVNLRMEQLQYKKDQVAAKLPPEFLLMVITASKDESSSVDQYCGNAANPQLNNVEIPYCGNSSFKIDLRESETNEIVNYLIEFPSPPDAALLPDSWIWFVNYTFEVFPTVSQWQQAATFNPKYKYSILFKSGERVGRSVVTQYTLKKDKEYETVDYKIILQEPGSRSEYFDNYYISMVMNALIKLLGTGHGIHFVSFRVLQNTPFRFEIVWLNCTLPADCTNSEVKKVNSILFGTANVGSVPLKNFFPPGIQIVTLDSKCRNTPPKAAPPLSLMIPVCGKYEFRLPDNVTYDIEDGTNLKVSMTLYDGTSLPRSSWIRYNPSSRMIYAFPDEGILLSQLRRRYLLWFEDSGGLRRNITMYVHVEPFKNVYYEIDIVFQSLLGQSATYLDIQCKMLELISEYTYRRVVFDDYRVMSFRRVGQLNSETYVLKYAICSVNQTLCKDDETKLLKTEAGIKSSTNNLQDGFLRYIKQYFLGATIQRVPKDLLVDEPPNLFKKLDVIVLTSCQSKRIDIRTVFIDEDSNLNYTLIFQNGREVAINYWVQVLGQSLYVYPWPNVTVGVYYFSLVVQDSCGSKRSTPVIINIQNVYGRQIGGELLFGYTWCVVLSLTVNKAYPDVYYLDDIKTKMLSLIRASSDTQIMIISYAIADVNNGDDKIKVTFGECSIEYIPCNEAEVTQLINKLFPAGTSIVTADVKKTFENFGTVINMTGIRKQTCGITPGSPDCPERLELNATYCEVMRFERLPDLCQENGILEFELFTSSGTYISDVSWVQLDSAQKVIYGYPLYKTGTNITTMEKYLLRVRDKDFKSRFVTVVINLISESPNMDYRMSMTGFVTSGTSVGLAKSQVDERLCIGTKLSEYLDRTDISNTGYQKSKQTGQVIFEWSFCEQQRMPCECSVIRSSQSKLQIRAALQNKMSECSFSVRKTSYELYGACAQTEGPKVRDKIESTEVALGQPYEKALPWDMFYDEEDGGIVNMTLHITDLNDERLEGAAWMRVENEKLCGLMAFKEFVRKGYDRDTKKEFNMVAMDSCGKQTSSRYQMVYRNSFPTLFYRIIFIFEMSYGNQNCSTVNEILDTIADYSDVPKSDIFVRDFRNFSNGTYMEWGIRRFTGTNCDNREFELYREKFMKDGNGNEVFLKRIEKEGYPLSNLYDRTDIECHEIFPWWILILILALILLFLLMWCLWCLVPRCCPGCCSRMCPGCNQCCTKGGKYSSVRDDSKSLEDITDQVPLATSPNERDINFFPDPVFPSATTHTIHNDVIDGGGFSDNRDTTGGQTDGYQTESWKDKRPDIWGNNPENNIIEKGTSNPYFTDDDPSGGPAAVIGNRTSNRYFIDSTYPSTNGRSRQVVKRSTNRFAAHDDYHGGESEYFYYHDGGEQYNREKTNEKYLNQEERFGRETHYGGREYPHRGGDGYYNRRNEAVERNHYQTPRGRRTRYVSTVHGNREPLAIRVRRGDLKNYARRRGRRMDRDNFYLSEKELKELLGKRNSGSKVYRTDGYSGHHVSTDSRLTDALVDRKVIRRYKTGNRDNNNSSYIRRHSLASLTEYNRPSRRIRETDRHTINPSNVHFKVEQGGGSTSSPYETSTIYTNSSGPTERLYLVDRNYFKELETSSSLDDMVITPVKSIPIYKKRKSNYANGNSHGNRYTTRRTITTDSRRRNVDGYRNNGYVYDESSV